jgi:hypothetical protein
MNTKTNRSVYSALMAGLLLLGVALACGSADETDKANKLVEQDGNAAIEDGKKYLTDAEEKKNMMLHTKISDASSLAKARALAKEAITAYNQGEDKLKEAVGKFEEASKLKISDKYKEYLALRIKEKNKRVELVEALKDIPQALIDSDSRSTFTSRANAATQKAEGLMKEANDLEAQAEKLEKDNPDSFKKS